MACEVSGSTSLLFAHQRHEACGAPSRAASFLQYDGLTARSANLAFGFGMLSLIVAVVSFIGAIKKGEFKGLGGIRPFGRGAQPSCLAVPSPCFCGSSFLCAAYRGGLVPYIGTLKRLNIPWGFWRPITSALKKIRLVTAWCLG